MAKKKKGNMRNIQSGDTVQFLNYLTPDHILRGKYNTGNNELDITDVPANLNSVITLGQGGGGGEITPIVSIKVVKNELVMFDINGFLEIKDNHLYHSTLSSIEEDNYTFNTVAWTDDGESFYIYFVNAFDPETSMFSGDIASVTDCVNCTYDSDENVLVITDPTQNASATVNLQ